MQMTILVDKIHNSFVFSLIWSFIYSNSEYYILDSTSTSINQYYFYAFLQAHIYHKI